MGIFGDAARQPRADPGQPTPFHLERQPLDGRRACRIRHHVKGGYQDQERWPEVQDAMIEGMIRFEQSLKPHLDQLDDVRAVGEPYALVAQRQIAPIRSRWPSGSGCASPRAYRIALHAVTAASRTSSSGYGRSGAVIPTFASATRRSVAPAAVLLDASGRPANALNDTSG